MSPPDRIDALARMVRRACQGCAEVDGRPDLSGWCGIASATLATLLDDEGFDARVADGRIGVDEDPHFWVMVLAPRIAVVSSQWFDYAQIVDVTATQFSPEVLLPHLGPVVPEVVRLEAGDPRRDVYTDRRVDHPLEFVDRIPMGDNRLIVFRLIKALRRLLADRRGTGCAATLGAATVESVRLRAWCGP